MSFDFLSQSSDHISFWRCLVLWRKSCETCPRVWQNSVFLDISIVVNSFFLCNVQVWMSWHGNINVLQWNGKGLFSRHVQLNSRLNMMTIHEISLNGPKNHSELMRHLLIFQVETLPYRFEILRWEFLSLRWIPVSELCLGIRSHPKSFMYHLPQEWQHLHLFKLSALLWHSVFCHIFDASNFSTSSKAVTRMSPFQIPPAIKAYPMKIPGNTFFPNWWILAVSFSEDERQNTYAPKGLIGSLTDSRIFVHVEFSSARRSWAFRWKQ